MSDSTPALRRQVTKDAVSYDLVCDEEHNEHITITDVEYISKISDPSDQTDIQDQSNIGGKNVNRIKPNSTFEHDHGHHHNHHVHSFYENTNNDSVKFSQLHNDHGHSHEHMDHPGSYERREPPKCRRYEKRAFIVGVGGPVGSGKTHLMLALCKALREKYSICAVTNDIFTREDGEFLVKHEALPAERVVAVETGGCPHAAIREDITANLLACEVYYMHNVPVIDAMEPFYQLTMDALRRGDFSALHNAFTSISQQKSSSKCLIALQTYVKKARVISHAICLPPPLHPYAALNNQDLTSKFHCDMILLESGGDNLAADFSRELADFTVYVIDTAGGDKIPRKGGPGITQSDLLLINKTDLAEAVGSSLEVMRRDAAMMRGEGPVVFGQVKHGPGVQEIVAHVEAAFSRSKLSARIDDALSI